MPIYEVYHSCALTQEQRQKLASSITDLHCSAFTTPAFFVHVRFIAEDTSDGTYFMAGKPRTTYTNRIIAIVRTSASRPIKAFETLGAKVEDAWNDTVKDSGADGKEKQQRHVDEKKLLMVTFTPMISIRESGMTIPEAGQEGTWLGSMMPYFQEMSEKGNDDFTALLQELRSRDDLRRTMS